MMVHITTADIIIQVDIITIDTIGTIINIKWDTCPTLKHLPLSLPINNYIYDKIS